MKRTPEFAGERVRSWHRHGVLLEHYAYPPGAAGEMTPHTHADYQICVSVNAPGEYFYRGTRQAVPVRSVAIIHPHETHAARDPEPRTQPAEFWVFYVAPEFIRQVAGTRSAPFFHRMVSNSARLFERFSLLPRQLIRSDTRLAQEAVLGGAVTDLLQSTGLEVADRTVHTATARLERARHLLEEKCAENPSLPWLAREAGMSIGRFSREFHRRYGRPPHRYLVQMRVERAKRLLADGVSLSDVAAACGFADQSHFTRHFRALTGVTPGRYHDFGRNVQDA